MTDQAFLSELAMTTGYRHDKNTWLRNAALSRIDDPAALAVTSDSDYLLSNLLEVIVWQT